jgi:flagellar basal-body rod protein FlgB
VDDNNVDIDIEMAGLSKNHLYYNAMTPQLGGFMTKMKNVITSGQS